MEEPKEQEEERKQGMVLVGFGKYKLSDMMKWVDTEQEEDLAKAFVKWPPVYRREGICTQSEIQASLQYLAFIQDVILEWDLNASPEGGKEKNDVAPGSIKKIISSF